MNKFNLYLLVVIFFSLFGSIGYSVFAQVRDLNDIEIKIPDVEVVIDDEVLDEDLDDDGSSSDDDVIEEISEERFLGIINNEPVWVFKHLYYDPVGNSGESICYVYGQYGISCK